MASPEDLFVQAQSNALMKDVGQYRDLIRILRRQKRMSLISIMANLTMAVGVVVAAFYIPKEFQPGMWSLFGSAFCCAGFYFSEYMDCHHQIGLYLKIIALIYGDKNEFKSKSNVSYLKPIIS